MRSIPTPCPTCILGSGPAYSYRITPLEFVQLSQNKPDCERAYCSNIWHILNCSRWRRIANVNANQMDRRSAHLTGVFN